VVPPLLAGLGLLGFAAALNRVYLKAPGLRQDGTLKPTQQGIAIAKDSWMTAIGGALVLDSLTRDGDADAPLRLSAGRSRRELVSAMRLSRALRVLWSGIWLVPLPAPAGPPAAPLRPPAGGGAVGFPRPGDRAVRG
jgi:hypothetical protein